MKSWLITLLMGMLFFTNMFSQCGLQSGPMDLGQKKKKPALQASFF